MHSRNRKFLPLLILCVLCSTASGILAQPAEIRFSRDQDLPDFHYDTAIITSPDSGFGRLMCFARIAYDELQFVREADRFRARCEVSIVLLNGKGEQVQGKIQTLEITAQDYDSTNSRSAFSPTQAVFDLAPGKYQLVMSVMDLDSKKTGVKKIPVEIIARRTDVLGLSDLILADRIGTDSTGAPIPVPSVVGNFSAVQDTLFAWFELFAPPTMTSVPLGIRILGLKEEVIRTEIRDQPVAGGRTVCVLPIPKGELKGGRYKLEIRVGEGKTQIKRLKAFTVHWADMPSEATDLDKSIEQLRYIAKGGEIKKMKKLASEEKLKAFLEYWKQRDPTPDTEANELMEEYYRRVEFTNQNFSTFLEGWKSDRGMVYILLGPPSEIERHPFESGSKPYEIWTYYSVNRSVLFVDHTGLGDYRLEGTIWDILNQLQ